MQKTQNNKYKGNILITGVSTGIGYELLKCFVKHGYRVYGSVRKQEDADRLQIDIGPDFHPLIFDVCSQEQIDAAREIVEDGIKEEGLQCLINNSGFAVGGPVQYQPIEEIQYHFDVNVIGVLRVIKAFLPLLGAGENSPYKAGRIINIGSVSGKISHPFMAAYSATKHALEGISQSLRRELLIFGIDVIVIGPGVIKTPIWDKGIQMERYIDSEYGKIGKYFEAFVRKKVKRGMDAGKLAEKILNVYEKKKPRTRYAFVPNLLSDWIIPRILSDRTMDRIIQKTFRLKS